MSFSFCSFILFLFEIFVTLFISLFVLDISVKFYVIDMIFSEKLLIGESGDFSLGFYIYIGRKWFGLMVFD